MSSLNFQFEEGDRIDHKLFGLGTVNGAPVAVVGPDVGRVGGVRDAGWRIPVRWDDPSRTAGAAMHHVLRKVSSPDSRPFAHWDRQWQSVQPSSGPPARQAGRRRVGRRHRLHHLVGARELWPGVEQASQRVSCVD